MNGILGLVLFFADKYLLVLLRISSSDECAKEHIVTYTVKEFSFANLILHVRGGDFLVLGTTHVKSTYVRLSNNKSQHLWIVAGTDSA